MMFWDKGYTPSQNIDALLQKEDLKLEELLDDDDLLQECKSQTRNLVQYLTRPDVIKRLIELITTEPPEDLPLAQRFRHANVAYEVLISGLPSLSAKIVGDPALLKTLYSFLEQEPPLNPLLSSFFCKTFGMLILKTYDRDWFLHQKMCLQVIEFIKDQGDFLDLIFRHSATPVITDLLLQITNEFNDLKLKKDVYDWLAEQQLVERLITILGQPEESEKHNNIAEFLCELIKHGRLLKQDEVDSWNEYEAFGDNSLLKTMESETTLNLLLDVMLKPNAKESTIVAGISVILALIDEAIYEQPACDNALRRVISQKKNNKQISTVIEVIAPRIKDFHDLLLNLNNSEKEIVTTAGKLCPPFGYTRLQICHLLTALTALGHDVIIVEICNIDYVSTLLKLFKQYTWNNFLHKEVVEFFTFVFSHFDPPVQPDGQKRPSLIQSVVLMHSKIISKLIDCWYYFPDEHSTRPPRRLGYMGHLINIFDKISSSMLESKLLGALIEATLSPEDLEKWKKITNPVDGELKIQLEIQNKMLADCNVYETDEYGTKQTIDGLDDDMRDFGNRTWQGVGVFEPSIDDLEANWSAFELADMDELIRVPTDLENEALDNMINRNGPFGDSPEPQDSFQAFANSSSCVVPPGDPFSVPNCTNSNSTIPEPKSMFNCFDDEDCQEFATNFDINLVPEQSTAENTTKTTPTEAPPEPAGKDTSSGTTAPTQLFVSETATTTVETSSATDNVEQSGPSDSTDDTTEAASDAATTAGDDLGSA